MMQKLTLPKDYRVYLVFFAVALLLTLMMPRVNRFEYSYSKGLEWKYETLVSDFDFPIYKTESQISEEKAAAESELIPYFRYSSSQLERCLDFCDSIENKELKLELLSSLKSIYSVGILPDEFSCEGNSLVYIQKEKRAQKYPCSEVYTLNSAKDKLRSSVGVDSLLYSCGILDVLEPNLSYDEETTELVHSGAKYEISPTMGYVSSGTLIVSQGEIVTSEIAQILDSYKKEYESLMGSDTPLFSILLGNFLISLILSIILFLTIYFITPLIFGVWKDFLYLVFIFLLVSLPTFTICAHPENEYLLFAVPYTLTALYLQAFFRNRLIISILIVSLLPLLALAHQGAALFIMFLLAGLVSIYMFSNFNKGAEQFVVAFVAFLTLCGVYFSFRLFSVFEGDMWRDVLFMGIGCVLSVVLYPFIYLFEKIFGLLSHSTLALISDIGSPLLRELEQKAPGTFQHSLQVANMADVVARAVDADTYLIRAGALYHDIGKMANPLCFVENESIHASEDKSRFHDSLTPIQSAQDITRHVPDGVEIARSRHLPEPVIDFIRTHHGTTCASYFFTKYVNEGGDSADMPKFCYEGPKPQSKEQVILMLCDSIEAASRTMKDYTPEAFDKLVESIVEAKQRAGQLNDSDITAKELGIVKTEIKSYLAQLYHARIAYPKRKK